MSFSDLYYQFGKKLANEKAKKYSGPIWHYTSSQGLKGILENKTLWFSDRRFLNDPTECSYLYRIIENNINLFKDYNENFLAIIKKIVKNITHFGCYLGGDLYLPQLICYIASFSKDGDNLELWNYYTKSQQASGYAIKMLTEDLVRYFNNNEYDYINGEIIYNKDVQINLIKDLLDAYNEQFDKKHGKNEYILEQEYLCELVYILEFYNIFFKPEAYKNEQEYRFVLYNEGSPNEEIYNNKFRIFNDIFIPYQEIDIPNNFIKEIVVSPATNQNLLTKGLSILKNSTIYKKAEISKSQIEKRY